MKHSGGWRSRRPMTWAVVVAFGAALLPASAFASAQASDAVALRAPSSALAAAALAKPHAKTKLRGLDTHHSTISLGRDLEDQALVVPRAHRVILVQSLRPGTSRYATQSKVRSSAKGKFSVAYRPSSAGDWRFRVVVKPTRTRKGVTSATRLVTVVDPADHTVPGAVVGLKVDEVTLDSAKLSWVNPGDADFAGVTIRRAVGPTAPASPTAGTSVAETGRTLTSFRDTGLTNNTQYSYSLFAHDASSNYAAVANISLRTTRTAVTGLTVTSVDRTTAALTWTNPTFPGFSGVTIRRALGVTPPSSATDGTAVGEVPAPGNTFTDTGLSASNQYTYAAFAHDASGNVAPAATLTTRTLSKDTIAVLKVNPIKDTGTRVTTQTAVAFDGSDSLPAVGADALASWDLNYGDGVTDSFNGPFAPDILNTTHTFSGTGDQTVTLTVRDSGGGSATTVLTVHVFGVPKVSLSLKSTPQAGVPLSFEVKPDVPNDTVIASYEMVVTGDDNFFLNGISTPPQLTNLTFAAGSYTVVFTLMTDADGSAVSDPVLLTVP